MLKRHLSFSRQVTFLAAAVVVVTVAATLAAVRFGLAGSPAASEVAFIRIGTLVVLAGAAVLLLACLAAAAISRSIREPLVRLRIAAQRVGEGDYAAGVDVFSRDELGDLAVAFNSMRTAVAEREQQIFQAASRDSLSGLPTGDAIVGRLRDLVGANERVAVIALELERLHEIRLRLGDSTADLIVRRVAALLAEAGGEGALAGHPAAAEFILALPATDSAAALEVATALGDRLGRGFDMSGARIAVSARIGIAASPEYAREANALLTGAVAAREGAFVGACPPGICSLDAAGHALRYTDELVRSAINER